MAKKRIKIPRLIENEVMDKSEGKCYCGKRGHEIHHIDGNPSNNVFDNLAFLCKDHHDDATIVLSKAKRIIKRFTPLQLKRARDKHYREIEKKKEIALKHYEATLKNISEENIYRATLDANITIEIIKIQHQCDEADGWEKQEDMLRLIRVYSEYSSLRISKEVIDLMMGFSNLTRSGMPADFSNLIQIIILDYFPHPKNSKEKKVVIELAQDCANIALNIIYDAFIYLGNLAVACSGFEILKYLQIKSKHNKIPIISEIVSHTFKEIEWHIARPERSDLENAKALMKIFKDDLNEPGLVYPLMPKELFALVVEHQKKSHQITH